MRAVAFQVLPELTSKRVLTMTFEEGVGVNDLEGLAAIGADKKEVPLGARLAAARLECLSRNLRKF